MLTCIVMIFQVTTERFEVVVKALYNFLQDTVQSQISTFITDLPQDSPIYTSFFASLPADFSAQDIADIQSQAQTVIGDLVSNSCQTFTKYNEAQL